MKKSTYSRNIGQNRGKPRLWLEKAILADNGFTFGARFNVEKLKDKSLVIELHAEGARRVSGAEGRPIIDINSGDILEGLAPAVSIEARNEAGRVFLHVKKAAGV